jgi:hypothetical protein
VLCWVETHQDVSFSGVLCDNYVQILNDKRRLEVSHTLVLLPKCVLSTGDDDSGVVVAGVPTVPALRAVGHGVSDGSRNPIRRCSFAALALIGDVGTVRNRCQ